MDNLEEIKKQISDLQSKVAKLENEKKQENKKENKRWRAEAGNEYNGYFYYIDDYGDVIHCQEHNDMIDDYRYKIRNYFATYEEAEEYQEIINTYYDLMDLADELNNGRKIDWNDKGQYKNSIYYDNDSDTLEQESIYGYKELGQIYCLDDNFKKKAVEKIGVDKLTKLFTYERS